MGGAVIGVISISSIICSLIYDFILTPLNLTYLNTVVFILVIATLVQFVEMVLKKCGIPGFAPVSALSYSDISYSPVSAFLCHRFSTDAS